MAILTQGTKVWLLTGGNSPEIVKMDCIKSISFGDDSSSEIDLTCLDDTDLKKTMFGMTSAGEGSISINTDTKNQSHMKLLELALAKAHVEVIVGLSDGTSEPTLDSSTGKATLPTDRSYFKFTAILRDSAPALEPDALVNHTIPMKRQTTVVPSYKTT